jgi:hypothetical protein
MSVIIKNLISNWLFKENNEQETYHFELACKQSFEKKEEIRIGEVNKRRDRMYCVKLRTKRTEDELTAHLD